MSKLNVVLCVFSAIQKVKHVKISLSRHGNFMFPKVFCFMEHKMSILALYHSAEFTLSKNEKCPGELKCQFVLKPCIGPGS